MPTTLCTSDPDRFDLEHSPDPTEALQLCAACPALDLCRRFTIDLVDRGLPPWDLVQGGEAFLVKGIPEEYRRGRDSVFCTNGHPRDETRRCVQCDAERQHRRRASSCSDLLTG